MPAYHRTRRRSPARSHALIIAAAAAATLLHVPDARAGSTWDGGGANASWSTAANWTGNSLPLSTDVLTFATGFFSGSTISLNANRTADSLLINTTSPFILGALPDNYSLTLTSGIIFRQDVVGAESSQYIRADLYFPTNATIAVDGSNALNVYSLNQSGGARSLTKTGNGILDLTFSGSGPAPLTGALSVASGTVILGDGAIDTTTSVSSGATLQIGSFTHTHPITAAGTGVAGAGAIRFSGSGALDGPLTLAAPTTVSVDSGSYGQIDGNLADGGNHCNLTKAGAGRLYLGGNDAAFSGNFVASAGTLGALSAASLGSPASTITVNSGAAFALYGDGLSAGRPISLAGSGDAVNLGALYGSGGSNTFTGPVSLAANSSVGAAAGADLTITGAITDGIASRSLTKSGAGTVVLAAANTYDGGTTVSAGALLPAVPAALGTGPVSVAAAATLRLSAGLTIPNPVVLAGTPSAGTDLDNAAANNALTGPLTVNNSVTVAVAGGTTLTLSGAISDTSGSAALRKTGLGRLVLAGSNAMGGSVSVGGVFPLTDDGEVLLVNSNALGPAGAGVGPSGSALLLSNNITVNRPVNLYGGAGIANAGALRNLSGSNTLSGTLTLQNPATVGADAGTTLTLSGPINYTGPAPAPGTPHLTKAGLGRLVLSGSPNLPTLLIPAGDVSLATSAAAPASLAVTVTPGGALSLQNNTTSLSPLSLAGPGAPGGTGALRSLSGSNAYNGPISLAADASVGVDAGSTLALNSVVSDAAAGYALTKVGQGTLLLNNNNTYSGGTSVAGGTLKISSDNALGPAVAPVTVTNAARLEFSANVLTARTLNANNGTLFADPGVAVTYSNATVTGGFLRGTGTHVLAANTSLLGTATLNGTTVSQTGPASLSNFSNGGSLTSFSPLTWDAGYNTSSGSLALNSSLAANNLTNDGLITLNPGATLTNSITPLVSGGGSRITIHPSATLTLASPTSLDLYGALLTNNGAVAGPVNVGYGATARGSGTYNGPVTVSDGGVFKADAPADAPATLVVDSLSLAADTATADISSSLVIDYAAGPSPLASVLASIHAAYDGGLWDKPGITSSLAADPANGFHTAVAYADNAQLHLTSFAGRPVDASALLLEYTWYGDANLDGQITPDDYALLDRSYARSLPNPHWTEGDFNYDGVVDASDYLLIDTTLGQAQGFSPGFLSQRESQFGAPYVSTLLASVPEPSLALFSACGLAIPPLLARRRRDPLSTPA